MVHQFEIESVFKVSGRNTVYVFARLIGEDDFTLSARSTLGNIQIENWLDLPRKHHENGNSRTDVFAFTLKGNNDKGKLKPGSIVELVS
jgi:hypothetical protein